MTPAMLGGLCLFDSELASTLGNPENAALKLGRVCWLWLWLLASVVGLCTRGNCGEAVMVGVNPVTEKDAVELLKVRFGVNEREEEGLVRPPAE